MYLEDCSMQANMCQQEHPVYIFFAKYVFLLLDQASSNPRKYLSFPKSF